MKKSYDFSKLDLNHFTENVWHIRAVYEDMVKHGRIGKFSFAHEERYERGAYRSIYYENEAITDMAYEFTMSFDDENPDRDQFIDKYGCDYDDAIIAFAEERLPKIFDCKTENIEQADANSYARKVAYFSVIADRAYKRLQEDHKLDDNRKPVVTFLQYTDFIGDMAYEFSNISELCFKNDIHFEAENFATDRILNRYGNAEWLGKLIVDSLSIIFDSKKCSDFRYDALRGYIDLLKNFQFTEKIVEDVYRDIETELANNTMMDTTTIIQNLNRGILNEIECILTEAKDYRNDIENLKLESVQNWLLQNIVEYQKDILNEF